MDEASLDIGIVVGERYCVEALIGLGGLAEVYKVRHLELGSVHALKLLTWNRKSLTERLLLEGRIQAQLTHPHIVRVTDVVRIDKRVGLLLEFIEGPSLEEFLEHHGALTVPDALGLFAPIIAAVAHAHDAGVLHRDLKPANVLLMRAPGGWIPKVTDFGLAKVVEDGLGPNTRTGISMGTPGYMPPEQVRNSASADASTDVFGLGCLLYEMIAGQKAFAPPDGGDIELTATIERTPAPLDGVSPELQGAIAQAIERDRRQRYQDARTFAAALGIADHPSLAASPDLVRVPLALDPSTYPSNPSQDAPPVRAGGTTPLTMPAQERRTAGPLVVGAIFGSVALAVLATAVMTQPVLQSRRAREAAKQAQEAATIEVPAEAPPTVPVVEIPPEPEAPAEPSEAATPSQPEPEAAEPPAPRVIEVQVPEEPTLDDAIADGEPVVVAAPQTPAPPSTEIRAEPPPAGPPLPVGTYEGQADRRPFELRVTEVRAGRVVATAAFFAGSGLPRVEKLEGTYDAATGRLSLTSPTSKLMFDGLRDGQVLSGQYMRGNRALPWRVTLP